MTTSVKPKHCYTKEGDAKRKAVCLVQQQTFCSESLLLHARHSRFKHFPISLTADPCFVPRDNVCSSPIMLLIINYLSSTSSMIQFGHSAFKAI